MPTLPHVAGRLFGVPLLVHGPKLRSVLAGLGPRLGLAAAVFDEDDERAQRLPETEARAYTVTSRGVAVLPVVGVLVHRAGQVSPQSEPLTSYATIAADLASAMRDPAVRAVCLDIESPGGEATGCFELARQIRALGGMKPIVACANGHAYSGGYAIASAAEHVTIMETGGVGSIGVLAVHVDQSGMDAKDGLAYRYILAGEKKADGNPHGPLSETAEADTTAEVDRLMDLFVALVAGHRPMTSAAVRELEAGCLYGANAVAAGLADAVGTLGDAILEAARRADAAEDAPAPATPISARSISARSISARAVASASHPQIITEDTFMPPRERDAAPTPPPAPVAPPPPPVAPAVPETPPAAPPAAPQPQSPPITPVPPTFPPATPNGQPVSPPPPPAGTAAETAASIVELCAAMGRPADAAAHIRAGRSLADVSTDLLRARAAASDRNPVSAHHAVGEDAMAPASIAASWEAAAARVGARPAAR